MHLNKLECRGKVQNVLVMAGLHVLLLFACLLLHIHLSSLSFCMLSQIFKWNVPSWWNVLPNSIWAAESLALFKNRLKHISSIFSWPSNSSTLYSNYILYSNSIKKLHSINLFFINTRFLIVVLYLFVSFSFIIRLTKAKNASKTHALFFFCSICFLFIY